MLRATLSLSSQAQTKNHQLLCTFSQEPILVRGITSAHKQRCSRASSKSLGFFNRPFFFGSKTRQPLETSSRSKQTKPFGDHQDLPLTRGVGYLIRFQVTYSHIPIQEQSRKCLRFHTQGRAYRFKALPFGGVHRDTKGGETGHT